GRQENISRFVSRAACGCNGSGGDDRNHPEPRRNPMAAKTNRNAFRPTVEALDARIVPTGLVANLFQSTGELIVDGTAGNDTITFHEVGPPPGTFGIAAMDQLYIDGVDSILVKDSFGTTVNTLPGVIDRYSYKVSNITINAGAGDDVVVFDRGTG